MYEFKQPVINSEDFWSYMNPVQRLVTSIGILKLEMYTLIMRSHDLQPVDLQLPEHHSSKLWIILTSAPGQ